MNESVKTSLSFMKKKSSPVLKRVSLKRTRRWGFSEVLNVLHYFVEARIIISADSTTFSDLELLS